MRGHLPFIVGAALLCACHPDPPIDLTTGDESSEGSGSTGSLSGTTVVEGDSGDESSGSSGSTGGLAESSGSSEESTGESGSESTGWPVGEDDSTGDLCEFKPEQCEPAPPPLLCMCNAAPAPTECCG